MATPKDADARRYYRAAKERRRDARFILERGRRSTAAVYLAGYVVECLLKALILESTPASQRAVRKSELFTHNLLKLRKIYLTQCGGTIPDAVDQEWEDLLAWESQLRYEPATIPLKEAERFLKSVDVIYAWIEEKF